MTRVVVLGGGPDAEREVSLNSSRCVVRALESAPGIDVAYEIIDRVSPEQLRKLPGEVIFPVLHGGYGEGGPLQDVLERDGRAYVGCGPEAARLAMDKLATKLAAAGLGIRTAPAGVFDARDGVCPFGLPAVLKPVHDGSSVGVHLCHEASRWEEARRTVIADMQAHPGRVYMVERLIKGRELTVGVLDPGSSEGRALEIIEIQPAAEFYDYEAKYTRDDTRYVVGPQLPAGVKEQVQRSALELARAAGIRHLVRVDFLLDGAGIAWLLEMNTMPGFTEHSLLPMAARAAGAEMPALCASLVRWALRDRVQ
jgi:D-alanine-D-alanine ligase